MNRWLILGFATMVAFSTIVCGPTPEMSFFVTSVRTGEGGNLGGLAGADAHCRRLAVAAGSTKQEWRAYLSASGDGGRPPVYARDRIGQGPWFNARGVKIAANVEDLHSSANNLGRSTSLHEDGSRVDVSLHDILTGSNADGTLPEADATCRNWTSTSGLAMVGHSNKAGSCCGDGTQSWNAAHLSEGCTMAALRRMGSGALLYCFAAD